MVVKTNICIADYFNDLWIYNLTSGWWTWVGGSNTVNLAGSYGLPGVAAAGNAPGARTGHSMAMDGIRRGLYIHGGMGYDASSGSFAGNRQ